MKSNSHHRAIRFTCFAHYLVTYQLGLTTFSGAKSLSLDAAVGPLDTGKQTSIAVISLANIAQQFINNVHTAIIFASNARDVISTIVNGNEIYSTRSFQ